ncbi:MAG: cation:proton antiporter [Fimbriimonas sp.]
MLSDLNLGVLFFLQLAIILLACRVVGYIGKFFGQTQVVCEMVAGVLLGPSLFGLLAPDLQQSLFPKMYALNVDSGTHMIKHPSMQILYVAAQLGLVLYMFLIGLEFDVNLIKKKAGTAILVSGAGVLTPFILGFAFAQILFKEGGFFGPTVAQNIGALYMGAAMCITAFPMLARIIYENGLSKTSMGTLALGAGATDDAIAWSILAVVLAVNSGSMQIAYMAIGGGILFGILMMTVGKKLLSRLGDDSEKTGTVSNLQFGIMATCLMIGAWFTDAIGIYAVFGAFIVGAAMPRGKFNELVQEKSTLLVTTTLLPMFFVYSGLNTKIGLLNTPALWGTTAIICVLAIVGKGVACALAARAGGESWRASWAIGTLMNSRGLMELIILNIGLQNKVITETLFTMMVIMAVVTTLMASPIYRWIYGREIEKVRASNAAVAA